MILFLILLLAVFQCTITQYLVENPDYYQLGAYTCETEDFRSMRLGQLIAGEKELDFDMLTALMIQNDYDLRELKSTDYSSRLLQARRPADYRKLKQAYETVLGDLQYFPVPRSGDPSVPDVQFEDGWMDKRTYKSGTGQSGSGGARTGEHGPGPRGLRHYGGEGAKGILSRGQHERRGGGEGGMAGTRRLAAGNPLAQGRLSVLRPSVRLQPGLEGRGCGEGGGTAGVYGRYRIQQSGGDDREFRRPPPRGNLL